MSTPERFPVEGFTVEHREDGKYVVRYPSGHVILNETYMAKDLEDRGIPVPPKPWVDPTGIGLTKDDAMAITANWSEGDDNYTADTNIAIQKIANKLREFL